MKILRKNDDFKKMPERNANDYVAIKSFLNAGWNYCSKQTYKSFNRVEEKEVKKVEKSDKVRKSDKKNTKKR